MAGTGHPALVIELGRFTVESRSPVLGIQVVEPPGRERGRQLGPREGRAGREVGELSEVEGSAGQGEGAVMEEVARWRRAPQRAQTPPEGEAPQAGAEPAEEAPEGVRPRRE